MDEAEVRTAAEEHATATVNNDLKTAASVLTENARAEAGGVMKRLPEQLSGHQVADVRKEADNDYVAEIVYRGSTGETTVESRWAQIEGRAMITRLKVL